MSNAITAMTDKVMRMTRSMVYLAMKNEPGRGRTAEDLSHFVNMRLPREQRSFHSGMVERVLSDLGRDGMVSHSNDRWFLRGV
jgi:hypothetical protein